MIVNPLTDRNLALAAQVGVTDIVSPFPGLKLGALLQLKRRVESFGMRLSHVERKVPHLKMVHDLEGVQQQIDDFKTLLRNMGEAEMDVLCYNWMPDEDWQRTDSERPERGGSKSTAFRLADVDQNVTDADGQPSRATSSQKLWDNLERFLNEVLPVAEEARIRLAIHPDDPPLPQLRGQARIITSNEAFQRVIDLAPSPSNGVCYCVGSFAPAGIDLEAGIRQLGDKLFFFHARNVRGTADDFQETWHDNGDIDMARIRGMEKALG